MQARRARLYDLFAAITVMLVLIVDQLTKNFIVQQLSPPQSQAPIPVIGQYLTIYYIQNRGAAFGMLSDSRILSFLIALAVLIVLFLYARMINSGTLSYKVVFGLIIGGAVGNLIDRARYDGAVIDFIYFRIPEIKFQFAIFNVADASISIGVFLLFVLSLFGGFLSKSSKEEQVVNTTSSSGALRSNKQDG